MIKRIISNSIKGIDESENLTKDENYIGTIVLISYLLKTAQLIVLILCGSYFTGLAWYLFCDLTKDSFKDDPQ